jgi:uncharacterized protein DUF4124
VRRALLIGIGALLVAGQSHAMVYSWRGDDGVYHFTNQVDDVPPGQLTGFRTFAEAAPSRNMGDGAAGDAPADDPPSGYAQGFEAGLRLGEQQIRLAGELARAMAESASPAPAAPVVYMPPPAPIVIDVNSYPPAYPAGYGYYGCGPWGFGYGCGPWVVGTVFSRRPFFGHRQFLHDGRGLMSHSFFAGRHGLHGARFGGRR